MAEIEQECLRRLLSPPAPRAGRSQHLVAQSQGDKVKYYTVTETQEVSPLHEFSVQTPRNKENVVIDSVNLFDQGRRTMFMSPVKNDRFLTLDTETGKLLNEIQLKLSKADRPLQIDRMVPLRMHYQYERVSGLELAGIAEAGTVCFTLAYDVRAGEIISTEILDESQYNKYKTVRFTSLVTAGNSYVATGDTAGAVRLYDDVSGGMKKTGAAMVLQPDDDKSPVIDLALRYDASMIVWTTSKAVYAACLRDEFWHKGWAAKKLTKPPILKLTAEGVEGTGKIKTPARFDASAAWNAVEHVDKKETTVFGCFGPYGVRWSIDEIQRASKKAEDGGKEIVYGKLHRLAEHKGETIPDHNSMYSDEGAVDLISTSLKVVKLFKD